MANFRIETERLDVTRDPRFGGDGQRHYARGLQRFYIDDVEVTAEEFMRRKGFRERRRTACDDCQRSFGPHAQPCDH